MATRWHLRIFAGGDEAAVAEWVMVQEHAIYPLVVRWFCEGRLIMKNGEVWLSNSPRPPEGHAGE